VRKEKIFAFFQFIVDLLIVFISYYGLVYLKKYVGKAYSTQNILAVKEILPYILIAFIALFFVYKLYEIDEMDVYEAFLGVVFSSIIIALVALALSFFVRAFAVPRTLIVYAFIFQAVFLLVSHYIIYKIYFYISSPIKGLVISSDSDGAKRVVRYIGELKRKVKLEELVLGKKINFKNVLDDAANTYDMFILDNSIPLEDKNQIIRLLAYKDKLVYIVPDVYELLLLNPTPHIIGDKMFLEVSFSSITGMDRVAKRVLDIIVSVVALIVFSPVILVVSLAILMDSGRPIYYLQERAGINGKVFKTIKFRTMIQNAEKDTGAILSNENDSRVTRSGKFLRRTGLDEIPQFVNVLRGEMSVAGPRPERPELIKEIKNDVPDFDMRLKVKPGITGFAQLAGKYDTPFDEKLKMDLAYGKQRFLFFTDIYIILNTIKLFFLPRKRK